MLQVFKDKRFAMATKNPRISVMLKPETDAILSRLAAVSKCSKSSIIAEFLEDTCMPMFERMVIVLEAAATASDDAKAAARQGFADAEQKLLGIVGMTTDLFESASAPLVEKGQIEALGGSVRAGRAAARAGGPEPTQPPYVTRGSHPVNNRKIAKTTAKVIPDPAPVQKPPSKAAKRPVAASKPKTKG
jgi:hypothetical protein